MMKDDSLKWQRLAAYFSGNLDADESQAILSWKDESEDNKRDFHEAELIWNKSESHNSINDQTEEEWSRFKKSIAQSDDKVRPFSTSIWLKVAAAVSILAIAAYFVLFSSSEIHTDAVDWKVISSGDKVKKVILPDSTVLWLNIGSELRYLESFGDIDRKVSLNGEAYFNVTKDSTRNFIVTIGESEVRVLGTSFNLRTDSAKVILHVAEGKVKFSNLNSENNDASEVLTAGEKAVAGAEGISKDVFEDSSFASWRELNNEEYDREKNDPIAYLSNTYTWNKNKINMSVVDGSITNHAELAVYTDIVLKVSFTKPNGTKSDTNYTVDDILYPGQSINYQKRLLDIFTDTQAVTVEIESARAVSVKDL